MVARTAYRIVREALTNVRKHAPGAHVVVRVSYDESQVRLSIRNTAAAAPPANGLAATGSGLGLAGLRQRIELMHGTLRAGAAGFLVKSTPPEDLIGLVRVAAGESTVCPSAATRRLIAASADSQLAAERARKQVGSLTEREVEVLTGLGEGLSNAQIAARLYLSEATVKGYVSRMLDKLGLDNRTQAGLLAHDAGLVTR